MHLSRQNARELPCFIAEPGFDPARGLLLDKSSEFPITRDGSLVMSFVKDWNPSAVTLLFYPTVILQFRHIDGGSAFWLLDSSFTYVGTAPCDLTARVRVEFGRRIASIATFLAGQGDIGIAYRIPDDVACFLKLDPVTRRELLTGFGHAELQGEQERLLALMQAGQGDYVSEVETDLDGEHRFAGPDQHWELLANAEPVLLLPGWRISRVSSVFFPVFTADLHHEDGRTAYWFFDRSGGYITDSWGLLPEPTRLILAAYSATILEDLWQDIVAHPGCRTRDHVAAFLELPAATRKAIFDFHHSPPNPQSSSSIWVLPDPEPEVLGYVAQTEAGALLLSRSHLQRCLSRYIQHQNIVLANEGFITWPSPIDGKELPASGFALLLDSLCFAYRVQDPTLGFTFYVVATEWHFRTFALYLPQNDLLVVSNTDGLATLLRNENSYRLYFLRHAVQFGAAILSGAEKQPGPLYHTFRGYPAMHIGHFIWQDLSGIHYFLRDVKPECVPQFLVPESHLTPEIYGPIDRIFPALADKVIRTNDMFSDLTDRLYREYARVIKVTTTYVPRAVGSAILASYKAHPGYRQMLARCTKVRRQSEIVVLFGLRVGNRTIVDIEPFAEQMIEAIFRAFPRATVILDGQNASTDAAYGSFGDNPASPDSFLMQELEIAGRLSASASKRRWKLISTIGRPVAESLLWCESADFFVAPWGAALAKYRWVCNKPGLVLLGRWNLQNLRELSIYDHTDNNENPAEMWFNQPDTAEDVIDAAEQNVDILKRGNYRLDADAIEAQLVALLRDQSAAAESRHSRAG